MCEYINIGEAGMFEIGAPSDSYQSPYKKSLDTTIPWHHSGLEVVEQLVYSGICAMHHAIKQLLLKIKLRSALPKTSLITIEIKLSRLEMNEKTDLK